LHPLWIGIVANNVVAGGGQAGSRHRAKVPEAGDADPHRRVAGTGASIRGRTGPGVPPATIMTCRGSRLVIVPLPRLGGLGPGSNAPRCGARTP